MGGLKIKPTGGIFIATGISYCMIQYGIRSHSRYRVAYQEQLTRNTTMEYGVLTASSEGVLFIHLPIEYLYVCSQQRQQNKDDK